MLLRTLPTLLLAATAAHALKDASPFFMLSSGPLQSAGLQSQQLATAHDIETALHAAPFDGSTATLYFLVSQPGLTAADLQHANSMPNMRRRISHAGAVVEIPEVMGAVDVAGLARGIVDRLGAHQIWNVDIYDTPGTFSTVEEGESALVHLTLEAAGKVSEGSKTLAQNDKYLDRYISAVNTNNLPYTIIFTSTPPTTTSSHTDPPYEMDETYPSDLHTDLKRDVAGPNYRRASNSSSDEDLTMQAGLPLFETYQFLSPAIFMGLSVSVLLFLILYVGVSAIAGLEVSYMAFSKEMGPKAQQGSGKQQ